MSTHFQNGDIVQPKPGTPGLEDGAYYIITGISQRPTLFGNYVVYYLTAPTALYQSPASVPRFEVVNGHLYLTRSDPLDVPRYVMYNYAWDLVDVAFRGNLHVDPVRGAGLYLARGSYVEPPVACPPWGKPRPSLPPVGSVERDVHDLFESTPGTTSKSLDRASEWRDQYRKGTHTWKHWDAVVAAIAIVVAEEIEDAAEAEIEAQKDAVEYFVQQAVNSYFSRPPAQASRKALRDALDVVPELVWGMLKDQLLEQLNREV